MCAQSGPEPLSEGFRRVLSARLGVGPVMDSPTGTYSTAPRLPLLTLDEAREAVRLLLHLADDTAAGREAVQLAGELGLRLPAPDQL